jgi:ComF family protein
MNISQTWLRNVFQLVYPQLCISCAANLLKGEHQICRVCYQDLPFVSDAEQNKVLKENLHGRIKSENALSLFYMRKNSKIKNILHQIKYKGDTEACKYLGNLSAEKWANFIPKTDVIIPVPLHAKKQAKRGYNQSELFAEGICENTQIELGNNLVERTIYTDTQTKKERFERWQNVENIFKLKPNIDLSNKHILLVDDVITTGSTIEALYKCIISKFDCKISVGCIAIPVQ